MTKYFLIYFGKVAGTLLLCLTGVFMHAQTNKTDSLKRVLPGATPREKMHINYLIGSAYIDLSPDSAMAYYNEALRLSRELKNDTLTARCLNKLGNIQFDAGNYEKAISNLFSALEIFQRIHDNPRAIGCLHYLSMAYNNQGMYEKALDYARESLEMSRSIDDKYSIAVSMIDIGSVYYAQSEYDRALENFQQGLHLMEELGDQQGIADGLNNVALIYEEKKDLGKALGFHLRSLALAKEMEDRRGIAASYNNLGRVYQGMGKFTVAIKYLDSCIALAKELDDKFYLKESYNTLSELYSNIGNFEMAYRTHLLYSILNDTLLNEENKRQFAEMSTKYETEKKDNQISLLEKDKDLQDVKMRKEKIIRYAITGGFAVVLLFAGVFFRQRNKIKKEKQRSDELLLNILPSETAEELKATGGAQAKQFDEVTVLFTDFRNFTAMSEKFTAQELVNEINYYYSAFDQIISKNRIEKIKTIGDSYMCAGGLPVASKTSAEDVVKTALEICDFIQQEKQKREKEGRSFFEIRLGCHTGPVVAGIVGIKKFAYDIWGDTVNVAARMEQNSEVGKINISAATYELVKDKFACTYRGKIQAKNKGEIDMYFVS
jgi:adenylate cyclase